MGVFGAHTRVLLRGKKEGAAAVHHAEADVRGGLDPKGVSK